jgi:Tol biopolymer transport system component
MWLGIEFTMKQPERYLDSSLAADTTYQYEIIAFDTDGNESLPAQITANTASLGQGIITKGVSEVDGIGGNHLSQNPAISGDGRYVAFVSNADNLTYGSSGTGYRNIYLYDKENDSLSRISQSYDGSDINGNSETPSVSTDGDVITL